MEKHSFHFRIGYASRRFLAFLSEPGGSKLGLAMIFLGIFLFAVFLLRTFAFKKKDWLTAASFIKGIFT